MSFYEGNAVEMFSFVLATFGSSFDSTISATSTAYCRMKDDKLLIPVRCTTRKFRVTAAHGVLLACASLSAVSSAQALTVNAGATPFLASVDSTLAAPAQLVNVNFSILPKPGAKSRAVSVTYDANYLRARGFLQANGDIRVPLFGLYAGYNNTVAVTYNFTQGPATVDTVPIPTTVFQDQCGYSSPQVVVARNDVLLSPAGRSGRDLESGFGLAVCDPPRLDAIFPLSLRIHARSTMGLSCIRHSATRKMAALRWCLP